LELVLGLYSTRGDIMRIGAGKLGGEGGTFCNLQSQKTKLKSTQKKSQKNNWKISEKKERRGGFA